MYPSSQFLNRHILPFLKKFGVNPITGAKCDAKQLVKLNYAKNAQDEYHCPITYKLFTPNSHIVAIRTTGNVYAYEAVETLNLKTKHMKDLLDDTPFTRSDIITIQVSICCNFTDAHSLCF
jgi:peptidyl-prolyl cis-trans isomerase-like protein 2